MNKKVILFILVVIGLATVAFFVNKGGLSQGENWIDVPRPVISGGLKKHRARPASIIINDKLATVLSVNAKISFQYDNKSHVIVANDATTNLWLANSAENIYVLWWMKTIVGKKLYFSVSTDLGQTFSEKKLINTAGGVLPDLDIAVNNDGRIAVMYTDERKQKYQVYINTSSDGGKTWSETDYRLDSDVNAQKNINDIPIPFAQNPHVVYLGNGDLLAQWQQKKVDKDKISSQFVARISHNNGKTWGDEIKIYTSEDGSYTVENVLINNNEDVVLVAAFPQKGLLAFHANANNIKSWKLVKGLKATEAANTVSWMKGAIIGNKMKVAYTIQKEEAEKFRVEVAELSLDTDSWNENIHRLDIGKDSVVDTKAMYADLKVLSNGEFVAVWEDYRGISPSIFIAHTQKQGAEWLPAIALTRLGYSEARNPRVLVSDNNIKILFEWYVLTDLKSFPRLSVKNINYDSKSKDIKIPKPPVSTRYSDDKKGRLEDRINAMMKLRVEKEWEKTWDFWDPIFKRKFDKRAWVANQGKITFQSYKLKKTTISSSYFGVTDVEVVYSLPQQILAGEITEATASKTVSNEMRWVWFYDDWYFSPKSSFTKHLQY